MDIDIVVDWNLRTLVAAEKALRALQLESRLPVGAEDVFNFRDEYVKNRNMVAWNFHHPADPSKQVDIVITFDLKGRKRRTLQSQAGPIRVLGLEELIEMKRASGWPQDLADIEALGKLP